MPDGDTVRRNRPMLGVAALALTTTAGSMAATTPTAPSSADASPGAAAADATTRSAGPRDDGSAITPVGYRVTPVGRQTDLRDLPLSLALSPDGSTLLVSNDGQGEQSLVLVDAATSTVTQTLRYPWPKSLFMGVGFSPDGSTAFASGGGDEQIHTYHVSDGHLNELAPIELPRTNPAGAATNLFPAGLAVTPDGSRLVVADHLADAVSVVDLVTKEVRTVAVGHAPLAVAVSRDSSTAYVSDQGGGSVSVVDLTAFQPTVRARIRVGTHPNALALDHAGRLLYVADGDSDEVSVVDTETQRVSRTVDLSPYAGARIGSNPTGLALTEDGQTLYVSNAGNNDVAVVDTGTGEVAGAIPTGWYPSAVLATADRLFVTNAKGLGAGRNSGTGHPDPRSSEMPAQDEYVASMMRGTLSTVALPVADDRLARWTRMVADNDGFTRASADPASLPIKHVIYVVQENRTFDQVFGSLGKGNGDPSLNLFGKESAPNQRQLQRRFVTLDNFFADAEVSQQGWSWTVAANSNPFTEQLWPAVNSVRNAQYDASDRATAPNRSPAKAYIWDRLAAASVTFRNYGFYVDRKPDNSMVASDPVLDAHADHAYRGFDLDCPNNPDTFTPRSEDCGVPRITEWKSEFDRYLANGHLPTVELVRLPNDHTAGTTPDMPTPRAYVADNDLALGRLVEAVSHSRYWHNTAIFVTEDDAQNGPDHVDAHRTLAQVISPYTQTGAVDSTFYSTASMLRTIENIVGVRPMSQFDAYATPMTASFTSHPRRTAYRAVKPTQAGDASNSSDSPLSALSAREQLAREDQIDMTQFNEAIWKSVKGKRSRMPAPRHALGQVREDDD